MKHKERMELWTTQNRPLHKRLYKKHLEGTGGIRCSYCNYNRRENSKQKYYGGREGSILRHPSWKLTSKNRKQWMDKGVEFHTDNDLRRWTRNLNAWVEIKF